MTNPIDPSLFYDDDGFCRLCSLHGGDHQDECPGSLFNKSHCYEITYDGDSCEDSYFSGHSIRGSGTGPTLEAALKEAAFESMDLYRVGCEARYIFKFDNPNDMLDAECTRQRVIRATETADREAKERLLSLAKDYSRDLRNLMAEQDDLKPEVYQRRLNSIHSKYAAQGLHEAQDK